MNILYINTTYNTANLIKNTNIKPVVGDKVGLAGYTPLPEVKTVILYPNKDILNPLLNSSGISETNIDIIAFYS